MGGDRETGAGGSSGSGSGAAVAVVRLIEKLFFNNLLEEFVGGKSTLATLRAHLAMIRWMEGKGFYTGAARGFR